MESVGDLTWANTALISMTTFFATVSPVHVAVSFAALTATSSPTERRVQAVRGFLIATVVLLIFAFFGGSLLKYMGISLPALRTAGGVLLFLIAIDLVFSRNSGGTTTTDDENREAEKKTDISVFPLATPLIAGPGAIGAAILLFADVTGNVAAQSAVIGGMLVVLVITLFSVLAAAQVQRMLGVTGLNVISRVMGILLAALAVQFVFDGIAQSGLI
ncbi:MAG: MarC family protein [Rhodospirillales bacterium]